MPVNEIGGGVETAAPSTNLTLCMDVGTRILKSDESSITVDGRRHSFSSCEQPGDIDWGAHGCDMVLECTGRFHTSDELAGIFCQRGSKRLVSAPVQDGQALNLVYGVNDHLYNPIKHNIVTAASCTTNCLAHRQSRS